MKYNYFNENIQDRKRCSDTGRKQVFKQKCKEMLTAALFTTALRCLLIDNCINKMRYINTVEYY